MDAVELTKQAAVTGLIAKAAVDVYRKSPIPSPAWSLPLTAVGFGIIGNTIVSWFDQQPFDGRHIAMLSLVGFLGGAAAVVTTTIHDWVRKDEQQ